VIARTAHALRFANLTMYLENDKADHTRSRAAWWSSYNIPAGSIPAAARWMDRTAERNRMVQRPAYHLFVAVGPRENASPARMRAVAEQLLKRLGLQEHQAVVVGHADRHHPHLHVAINRVHPVTGQAWDTTRDWPRIERALRAIEEEMGFAPTPGRLAPTPDGRWCDNARAMPVGARRFELREDQKAAAAHAAGGSYTPRPSFLRFARESFGPEIRAARSWADLEAAAARHGLTLIQKERGMVVTDGSHFAAISRVFSGASLGRLTREYGEDYVRYVARQRGGPARDVAAAGADPAALGGSTTAQPAAAGGGTVPGGPAGARTPGRSS
jgi:hypothetical protein